jgi:error-prone DNA polymerase
MNMPASPAYAEFAVQSNFSFLRGASKPEELVVTAERLGLSAVGLADRNTVAGVVRAWQQSKTGVIRYHPGSRLVFSDGTPDILAYPRNRKGWGHLCRLLTQANLRDESEKGVSVLYRSDILEWGAQLSLAVLPDVDGDPEVALELMKQLREQFGDAVWLAVSPTHGGNDAFRLAQAAAIAAAAGMPMMAVNDVLYHEPGRRPLQDVLTAIRLNVPVAEAGLELQENAERHLKRPFEMARLFRHYPRALAETLRFEQSLSFCLSELKHNYPEETTEPGADPQIELEKLTWDGAHRRYRKGIPEKIQNLILRELEIIDHKQYARYFLTVQDIIRFARSKDVGILCQGRGSAANSVVCFCLGITEVDPNLMDVLFERFVSTERDEPPDIDVDFEHERRDQVIAYIYKKYSDERTALASSVVTYRNRSALREVAKALGLSDDVQSALSSSIWGWSSSKLGEREAKAGGLDKVDTMTGHLIDRANEILEFPRHLSQHVGGFVITKDRLDEIIPIVKTAMDERRMVEWDKDDLDAVGLLKVDVLALGMLSCLRRAIDLLHGHYPHDFDDKLTLATIPQKQEAVYDMICRADTLGVFQIESRAQMSMLPRLRPRTFYDLVIEVAIVRPGPIQGDMVHPYLRRRQGLEKQEYPGPELEAILKRTLGVPLFQEQAMKIAIDAGGFSPSEADKLRRAMATFKRTGTIDNYEERMVDGMIKKGYPEEFARRCFNQIKGFGEYGFPESHAASFALLVYASSWFKTFYPDIFCAAILNSQPMGFYAPAQLVRDAREHGVEVHAVDVNFSTWDCLLEKADFDPSKVANRHADMRKVIRTCHAVRLGFRQIRGLVEEDMDLLVQRRGDGYESVRDLWLRSGLPAGVIERLAAADAFRSLGIDRREALWAVRALDAGSATERLPLFERPSLSLRENEPYTQLPVMPLGEHVIHDYRTMALSLKAHPVSFLRERLEVAYVLHNGLLGGRASGACVSVSGLVLVRQRPGSAKGVIFMTIEDETGIANIIVWKRTFERFRSIVLGARFVRVKGKVQSESGVIHVVADSLEDLTPWLADLSEEVQAGKIAHGDVSEQIGQGKVSSHPRATRLIEMPVRATEDIETLSRKAGAVMPKGRNFQ